MRHIICWARWANKRGAGIYVEDIRVRQVRGKARALSPDQVAAAFAAASGHGRLFLRFLYDSGLRLSEALAVTAGDCLCGESGIIISVRGKGGKIRMVTVGARVERELRAALAGLAPTERVFPWKDSGVQSAMKRMSDRLGFRVSAHRLRHSFANATTARGIPMEMLRKLMGHADLATTDIYAQMYDHQVLEAFRRFSPVDGMEE